MKPTSDDFAPRRDGWFEHRGVWGEVTVGTVIASQKRTERWEVIDSRHGNQVQDGRTLWMRLREQTSGEERTDRPRPKDAPVTILTRNPADVETPPRTPPADTDVLRLLVTELGAHQLASVDNATGEVTCPNYGMGYSHEDGTGNGRLARAEVEHLRIAHGLDVTALEALPWDQLIPELARVHGRLHEPPSQPGGFPHRHVPEDLSAYTGERAGLTQG